MRRTGLLAVLVTGAAWAEPPPFDVVGQGGIVGAVSGRRATQPVGTVGVGLRAWRALGFVVSVDGLRDGHAIAGSLTSAGQLPSSFSQLPGIFFGLPRADGLPFAFEWSLGAGWGAVDSLERWQLRAAVAFEFTGLRFVRAGPFIRVHHLPAARSAGAETLISAGVSLRLTLRPDDVTDRCPDEAEDVDGFEDDDGCPDADNDRDGVPDVEDHCPNAPMTDGRRDGCPRTAAHDRDADGFADHVDRCPDAPEDRDGVRDDDGCPEPDDDGDGFPDVDDRCPAIPGPDGGCPGGAPGDLDLDGSIDRDDACPADPEDKDGFQDEDGCPDFDNDADGVLDGDDRCPLTPGPRAGCPD